MVSCVLVRRLSKNVQELEVELERSFLCSAIAVNDELSIDSRALHRQVEHHEKDTGFSLALVFFRS